MNGKIIIGTDKEADKIAYDFINILPEDYDKKEIEKAYELAKLAHQKQFRKSGDLYITHPIEVAKLSYYFGLDTDSICAAFLHDVLEDTDVNKDDLLEMFKPAVVEIVVGLTKLKISSNTLKTDIEKNLSELRRMLLSASKDIRILIIKLCDRVHNMRTLNAKSPASQKRISKETLYVYAPIAQKVGIYELKWELEDLAFKYLHPKDFEFIKQKIKLKREIRESIAQKAVQEIRQFLLSKSINDIIILGRPKNMYSIYRKITKKKVLFEDIYDLYAIRVICKSADDCYHIHALLNEHFKIYENRIKDYIKNPKKNGYQSIHTTIFSNAISSPIEVQIRDSEMHKLAEYGIAAHWKYKNIKKDEIFDKKISWLRELLQWEQENKETFNLMQALKYDLFDSEIFIFTPKHDIIALPQGATALDFAYYIHTEIGNSAIRARVNSETSNLDKILQNGDIVEIIVNPKSKVSEKALKIAKTNKARVSIRQSLGLRLPNKRDKSYMPFTQKIKFIEGLDSYSKIKNPRCCTFELKDDITGVETTKESELVIHNAKCKNAKFTLCRKFKLLWSPELLSTVKLEIFFSEDSGVLVDLLDVLKKYNLSPLEMRNRFNKDGGVFSTIKISKNKSLLLIVEDLKKIKGIRNIRIQD